MSEEILTDEEEVQRAGREAVGRVSLLLKLATVHQLSNDAMNRPIEEMLELVKREGARQGVLNVQVVGEHVFLNQEIVKLDYASFESGATLRRILERVGAGEIALQPALTEESLREFLARFQHHWSTQEPTTLMNERFEHVVLRVIEQHDAGMGGEIDQRQNVLRTYARLALAVGTAIDVMAKGRPLRARSLRRSIQELADASVGHESLLVGMTRFPNMNGDIAWHAAAVTALVLLMTRRLGLGRRDLAEACMSAILHDLGRADLPDAFSSEQSGDAQRSWQRVPAATLKRVGTLPVCPPMLGYAAAAATCSCALDRLDADVRVGALIAVPCAFDLMTNAPPPHPAVPPDQALRLISERAGGRFDPDVVQLFSQVVGLFPVGTTVRLSGGETAIVMDVPDDPADFARPRVKVVRKPDGPAGYIVDLTQAGGLSIVESLDPLDEAINVPHFLLA
jgi:HD-GYP domain-containing protein (c-di-GMP phosphodiesterase class II)